MKDSFWYPIIFMLIVVVIFVGVLALMFRMSEAKIAAYEQDSYQKLVLKVLSSRIASAGDDDVSTLLAAYPESYERYVKPFQIKGSDRPAFAAIVNDSTVAYCFEIKGKGLWGSMRALVSTSPDLTTISDFSIVNQMETPGLGARIEEDWFLAQFRDRIFAQNPDAEDVTPTYEFIAETQEPENDGQLKRVTGATITSDAVVRMLKDEYNLIYDQLREPK